MRPLAWIVLVGLGSTGCLQPMAEHPAADGGSDADPAATSGDDTADAGDVDAGAYVAPTLTVSAAPYALVNTPDFTIQFTVVTTLPATTATITCAFDEAAPVACVDHFDVIGATDGDHLLSIVAVDDRGNVSDPVDLRWKVDATAPVVTIAESPAAISGSADASIEFDALDNMSGVTVIECAYDGGVYGPCTSPQAYTKLTEADHVLKIRATDTAGNVSAEAIATWKVDLAAPILKIATGPATTTKVRTASFTFSGTEIEGPLSKFQCALDNAAFAACTSPMNYAAIADGKHTFDLRATGQNGIASSPLAKTWTVDGTAPTAKLVSTPAASTTSTAAMFQFSASDSGTGVASIQCALDGGAFATCTSPKSLDSLSSASHTFAVKALDNAGNTGSTVSFTWKVTPPTCTSFTYSAYGACQSNGTQSRSITSSSPSSCTGGNPVLSQSCTYVPPKVACTSFTYSAYGACQPNGTQTRTETSASPSGCSGGSPVLSQSCTYVPPKVTCTSFTYSSYGSCQPNDTQSRTVTSSSPSGCTGGNPVLSQSCTYVPPVVTCTSFTYSAYGACQPNGKQTRTEVSASPAGCTGGSPVLSQSCTYIDGAALYSSYCAGCHGNAKKGRSTSAIQGAINSNVGGMGSLSSLTSAQIAAISAAP